MSKLSQYLFAAFPTISTSGCNDLHNILSKYAVSRRISTPVFRRYSTLRSFSAGNSVSFAAAVPNWARDLLPGRRAGPCCMRKNRPAAGSSNAFRWRVFPWTATGKTKWRRSAQQNAYNDARPAPKRCGPFLRRAVTDVSVRRYRSLILDRIRSSKSCCRPL